MRFILNKDYRLCGWTDRIACVEHMPTHGLLNITVREYGLLSKSDGVTDVDTERYRDAIARFTGMGVIAPADGASLMSGQEYRFYENRCIRGADICITGRCDFKCRHCFNAADNDHSRGTQPATELLVDLIARLDDCGVTDITLSGGEPLLHSGLLRITQEIADRNMTLRRLVTNLYHMTPQTADALIEQGHRPLISTSFDGIGKHEWLRLKEGSEQHALDSIAYVKSRGFRVRVTTCAWRDNLSSLRETMLRLQQLGVDELRLVPVEPSLRWRERGEDQQLSVNEWLDFLCEFIDWWYENRINMQLRVWSFWFGEAGSDEIDIIPDMHCLYEYHDRIPACADAYNTPYIDSDGRIAMCNPVSGYTKSVGMEWGNVFTDDLHALLREGPFMDQFKCTVGKLKKEDPECRNCEWIQYCGCGCRAEALAYNGKINSPDRRMCVFFKQGYYGRFKAIADKYGLRVVKL